MGLKKRMVAVVGAGPAGLMAAEAAVAAGAQVTVYDHQRSAGRKFLVAGKSGLNITNAADFETLCTQYTGNSLPMERWRSYIQRFDNSALRQWARDLGVETFVAGGGKVFPESKKAAPLLRRWLTRLKTAGVCFEMNQLWSGLRLLDGSVGLLFAVDGETQLRSYDAAVLALGGGSWPHTGSDGGWIETLSEVGVATMPLQAANCGWACHWNLDTRAVAEGQPLHHLEIKANGHVARGELMVTRYGLEGTPLYHLGAHLRAMSEPALEIDFKPIFSFEHMVKKMESARRNFYQEARVRWKLTDAMCAILRQQYGDFDNAEDLARASKCCRLQLTGPRPLGEAISSAGGVAWSALDRTLMLKQFPGVYCAGEMIDWEAPTGGFLLQGCLATGRVAGAHAGS